MPTKEEYLKAKQTVQEFEENQKKEQETAYLKKKQELDLEQANCDHHYISSGGKWTPVGQMTCIYCNKTI